jgi:hypothetical protein
MGGARGQLNNWIGDRPFQKSNAEQPLGPAFLVLVGVGYRGVKQ